LIDCSWGFGNDGCEGGEDWRAYDWIIKHGGIATEDSYGPYLGEDGYCNFKKSTIGAKMSGYVNVTPNNTLALKMALVNEGPIGVGFDAEDSFLFYSNGVYAGSDCSSDVGSLNHMILIVGYGSINGQDYWLAKNR